MRQDRYPKLALEGYVHDQRGRGGPKKRWLDVVRSDCADMGLTVHDAIPLAQDRHAWRQSIDKLPLHTPCRSIAKALSQVSQVMTHDIARYQQVYHEIMLPHLRTTIFNKHLIVFLTVDSF